MKVPEEYSLSSYKYNLPEDFIAQTPPKNREDSRLLILRRENKIIEHSVFKNLPEYFSGEEVLVLNESKVIPARVLGNKETGGAVELLISGDLNDKYFQAIFKTKRGLKAGAIIKIKKNFSEKINDEKFHVKCLSVDRHGYATFQIQEKKLSDLFEYGGITPLPPYIKREKDTIEDRERYQTVYARIPGSIAAPTAGLHFTDEIFEKLMTKGVKICKICLHVSYGTFKPIKCEDVRKHHIDEEIVFIDYETSNSLNEALKEKRPIVAVGTTVVRALEDSFADGVIREGIRKAKLYIMTGYKFNVVSRLITNFHLPGSSLLLLVSAFAGREKILSAYREAIKNRYRFYSYGDCMLIM